ncbi:ArpU family phage packaging/lysis transcriptional regulator [Lacticaseibacillus rhamnosus]|uniref:hypothetical protein n=1 Tax=Lacticaseibacillus rhamnosus TaxID=47715 RepID=UPI0007DF9D0B|nr:hypothetical protein [Lacticaseibacillus rhamnosus]OAU15211.1 transcriptional regulator [Lacticaseibacillus rhamnosus]OAU72354.1 transcriptional regulator [Lacticaseibacillus rhamnosus]
MELLSISDEKDREAVENILNKYRAERGFIKAPVNPKITSAWGDGTSASTVQRPLYAQRRLERQESARKFCEWCDSCIASMPKQSHQRLLRVRYCDGPETDTPDGDAMNILDISAATYTRRKKNALLAAAWYFGVTPRKSSEQ